MLVAYFISIPSNLYNDAQCMTQFALTTCINWSIFCNPHINTIFVYLLIQERFFAKSTSSSFFLKVAKHDYSISFSDCLNLSIRMGKYRQGRGNTLYWEQIQSLTNLSSTLKFLIPWPYLYFANFHVVPTKMV